MGIEVYLIPHAIAGAVSGVSVAFYLNDLTTTSASHAIITPEHTAVSSRSTTSILTLPNGARYDVNQTYETQAVLEPFTWPLEFVVTKATKALKLSEQQLGNYLGGFATSLEGIINQRAYAICLRPAGMGGPNQYAHILTRMTAYTFNRIPGMLNKRATGSVTFDPIDTEWQAGWPSP